MREEGGDGGVGERGSEKGGGEVRGGRGSDCNHTILTIQDSTR